MPLGSRGVYEALKKLFVTDANAHVIVDSMPAITGSTDISDRAARLLGIVYGNLDKLQQRTTSLELLVQLCSAGVQINPQTIRALTSADIVTVESLTKWGGTALTGRDISLDLRELSSDSEKGLLRSIGDTGASPSTLTGKTLIKTASPPWYQPNFTTAQQSYSTLAIAPHNQTQRWTYTVPASRIAKIMSAQCGVVRDGATANPGFAASFITIAGNVSLIAPIGVGTLGASFVTSIGEGPMLPTGTTIIGYTIDLSTLGTCYLACLANLMIFDA